MARLSESTVVRAGSSLASILDRVPQALGAAADEEKVSQTATAKKRPFECPSDIAADLQEVADTDGALLS